MTITCDRCSGEYEPRAGSAVAHVFVEDSRCNHLEARCGHCGATEVIFVAPHRLADAVSTGRLELELEAEAPPDLRLRAERAWAAAEEEAERLRTATSGQEADTATLRQYELTPRHERLLTTFGRALTNIPDDLLWDELQAEHDRRHPERWTD